MAYVSNQNKQIPDEEQNQFGGTGQTTTSPIPPQTGSAGTGGQANGGAAPGVASSTQFGSNAAKLSDYLKANESQVDEFGQQVSGKLNKDYQDTLGSINSGFGDFSNKVNQGYTANNQDLLNQAKSNPTQFAANDDNVKNFQSLYNDTYKGPENVESSGFYGDVNNKVTNAVQNAGLTNSFSGLSSYLNNFMGGGNKTQGMNTLDTALLQRSPTASKSIRDAATPYQGLTDYLGQKTNEGNQSVAGAKDTANQISSSLKNQYTGEGGIIPNFQNTLNQNLATTRTNSTDSLNEAIRSYQRGNSTPEQLKLLGFTSGNMNDDALVSGSRNSAQILQNEYGTPTDWNSFFTQTPAESVYTSPGSAATPDQLAQAQALSRLTGQDMKGFLGATSPNGSLVSTNKEGLSNLTQQASQKDTELVENMSSALKDAWGKPSNTVEFLVKHPEQVSVLLDSVKNRDSAGATHLEKVLKRMGFNTDPTVTLPPAKPGDFTSKPIPVTPQPGDFKPTVRSS